MNKCRLTDDGHQFVLEMEIPEVYETTVDLTEPLTLEPGDVYWNLDDGCFCVYRDTSNLTQQESHDRRD